VGASRSCPRPLKRLRTKQGYLVVKVAEA
jgi:hypothetical protein